jgi:hypothetical protein
LGLLPGGGYSGFPAGLFVTATPAVAVRRFAVTSVLSVLSVVNAVAVVVAVAVTKKRGFAVTSVFIRVHPWLR